MGVAVAGDEPSTGVNESAGDMEVLGGHESATTLPHGGTVRTAPGEAEEEDGETVLGEDLDDMWVANILIKHGEDLPAHGCFSTPTSYLVVKVKTHGEKARSKTYVQLPPVGSVMSATRRTRKGDLLTDWQVRKGEPTNWNSRFQVPLPQYRSGQNPTVTVQVWLKGSVVDERLGAFTLDLPSSYPSEDIQPGEVSSTGYLPKGDDGWGDCMHNETDREGHIGRGTVTYRRVFFKPCSKSPFATVPEVYNGTIVMPNMFDWGLGIGSEARNGLHHVNDVSCYEHESWPFVQSQGDNFDINRMTGEVKDVNGKKGLVQVQWHGDSEARWYRCGHGATDVIPLVHATTATATTTQWNPLDFYEGKDVRQMVYVLRQMYQLVTRMINQELDGARSTERLEEIIDRAILPTGGWSALHAILSAVIGQHDQMTSSETHSFKYAWDTEASGLKRDFLAAVFDPSFPARDRYHLLHSCRIISEDIDDDLYDEPNVAVDTAPFEGEGEAEQTAINVAAKPVVYSPLLRTDAVTWEEIRSWRDSNVFTPAGLAACKEKVLEWTREKTNARAVKSSVDRLLPKLVARLESTGNRSVVLSQVFLAAVTDEAVRSVCKMERDLRALAGLTGFPGQDEKALAIREMLSPLWSQDGSPCNGPHKMMKLVSDLEEASLLQTAEAIEDTVSVKPRVPGKDFIHSLQVFSKAELRKGATRLGCGERVSLWWERQRWLSFLTRSDTCEQMEAKHGSAIGEFFKLLLFCIRLNIVGFVLWFFLVIVPWADWIEKSDITIHKNSAWGTIIGLRDYVEYSSTEVANVNAAPFVNYTSVAMQEGNWFLYGAYPPRMSSSANLRGTVRDYTTNYRMDAAWTATALLTLIIVFLIIMYEIGKRMSSAASGIAKGSNVEQYKAKWTRTLKKDERYGADRLSLVDQQLYDSSSINPTRIDQIEEVAELQLLDDEKITALLNWNIGLNDRQGGARKMDSGKQYWELQHALIGYSRAEPEKTGQVCSDYNRVVVLRCIGWFLSAWVIGCGIWLLWIVLENRQSLDDESEYIAPFVISCILSVMPTLLKFIVRFLEYYEDPNHAIYHSISRQFFAKMFGLLFVALTALDNKELSERCHINDTATLFYQLVFMGLIVGCAVNFGMGLAFRILGHYFLFPNSIKKILTETTRLSVPKKYWPAEGHTAEYDETTRTASIENDSNAEQRAAFVVAAEMGLMYASANAERDNADLRNTREELLAEQLKPRDSTTDAEINRLRSAFDSEASTIRTKASESITAKLTEASAPDAENCVQDVLEAQSQFFETKDFALEDYADDYEMQKVIRIVRKVLKDVPEDVALGGPEREGCDRAPDASILFSTTEVMPPLHPGTSGFHMPHAERQRWRTDENLLILDVQGEMKPQVRAALVTSVEKKRTKILDEALKRRAERIIDLQNAYNGSDKVDAVFEQICTERREFKRELRDRVYLRQKKHYSQRVNRALETLQNVRETMPPASGKSEYDLPAQVIDFIYLQSIIWAGSAFSPMMMIQGVIATAIYFYMSRLIFQLFHTPLKYGYFKRRKRGLYRNHLWQQHYK